MRILCSALILIAGLTAVTAQTDLRTGRSDDARNADLFRLRAILDRLSVDARTLQEQNSRSYAITEVADAYWELDQAKAGELFVSALDSALALDSSNKDRDPAIRSVLASAAKRNAVLTKKLIDRLLDEKDHDLHAQPIGVALDLLQVDRKAAEAVALASANAGLSLDSAWFIFELQKQDPEAADRVYLAHLNNAKRGMLSELLWLAGYPFGYVEAFGGSTDPLQLKGIFGVRRSSLSANPALARAFLVVATDLIHHSRQQSNGVPPDQAEALHELVFFISTYLSPQISFYSPDLITRWRALQQTATTAIRPPRREAILRKVNEIFAARKVAEKQTDETDSFVEDSLTDIDKLPACQKDSAYARALFSLSHKKNFTRAISVADKIYDLELRSRALQFVYYDMAVAALSTKTDNSIDEAMRNAERLTSPEQRALLYMRIAEFSRANGDRDRAFTLLLSAGRLAERVEEPASRTGLLFSVAYELTELDSTLTEPMRMMREAIDLLNDNKSVKMDKITLLRRVDLGCDKRTEEWYGSSDPLVRFNLIETLVKLAGSDYVAAEALAGHLAEGPNRVRALAAIAGAEIRAVTQRSRQRGRITRI